MRYEAMPKFKEVGVLTGKTFGADKAGVWND
jgi:hypothetical protein